MKIIRNENFLAYINRKILAFFTKTINLIYILFALFGIIFYWYEAGFEETLRILIMFLNAGTVLFFFVELLSVIITSEIHKSKLIIQLIVILILSAISFIFYDENFRYWSFVLGIILFIPSLLLNVFEKIRTWLK